MIKETFQDLNRLRQIATIAAQYGFGEWLNRAGIGRILGREPPVEVSSEAKQVSAAASIAQVHRAVTREGEKLNSAVPVVGVLAIAAAAGLFGATLAWYVFGARLREVRVSRMFERKNKPVKWR